ncbi:penicillin-binding transpeptidase domain-containing protein [Pseudonocardia sp. TRM90224]|uniref:penicillin-binding transpeptidase domain-containing protein n=1 Tax=Pseudonocardia sp. TRM90224 TaxID=2812678 RepID=UPI001E407701|nr:penicillin-binding transpeptidase domain-containing protein [Pseudonocardia sp. TRM90224]
MRQANTRGRARRGLVAALGATILAASTAGCGLFGPSGEERTATAFVTAWSAGDIAGAAALTDDPKSAGELLTAARNTLAPERFTATLGQVRTATDRSAAAIELSWDLGKGRTWSYPGELELVQAPDTETGWAVRWTPAVVHPQLSSGQRLALATDVPEPAPVVDRAGVPLLSATPVVTVNLDRLATGGDLPGVTSALAKALGPLDDEITQQSITDGAARTPDGQAYTVAVLREPDYLKVKAAIYDLPGVRFVGSQRLLPPSAGFASQVLPAVRTEMGAQLEGVPGWSVQVVDQSGVAVRVLNEQPPKPGTTVTIGLDQALQAAAEAAVEPLAQQAMIVAIAPSTGDVLAVAQNGPADVAGALALTGRYPPGSTFKIATAEAAISQAGLNPDSPVACPGTTTIGGRLVPNADEFELGTVPLRTAFARSCNTTFAQLGSQLGPDALPQAALTLGIGADFTVPGLTTITGSVPTATDPVQRAENGFGQGDVLASPLGMALATATVARGAPVVPELIHGRPTQVTKAATTPDRAVLDQVRQMMRAVVTEGTATRLAGLGEVYGKTGTAEFTDNGRAHGWFVGYRGDVAFAVLVVDAGSSEPAVATAQRFLSATG